MITCLLSFVYFMNRDPVMRAYFLLLMLHASSLRGEVIVVTVVHTYGAGFGLLAEQGGECFHCFVGIVGAVVQVQKVPLLDLVCAVVNQA